MAYEAVSVYDLDGKFIGYSIYEELAIKLHTANLWTEDDADIVDINAQIDRLNNASSILQYWPLPSDPAVQVLVTDPDWEPLKLSDIEVIDEDLSDIVQRISEEDGFPEVDDEASTFVYKIIQAPAPVEVQARIKKACEIVARQRAGI